MAATTLAQDTNAQFDYQRQKAAQSENTQLQRQKDALARRAASLGGAPGGAFDKQNALAADESAQRLASANEGINQAADAEGRRLKEVQEGRQYSTSEREASQNFGAGQAALQRAYGTSERLGSQAYGTSERLGGEANQASLLANQQAYGTRERIATQDWTADENKIARDIQESQFGRSLEQNQTQFDKNYVMSQEDQRFNEEMANKVFNKKDLLEQLLGRGANIFGGDAKGAGLGALLGGAVGGFPGATIGAVGGGGFLKGGF